MDEVSALELELHDSKNKDHIIPTLHSFVAGCTSGIASIVVGQPFDTVKVRMQTASYNGPIECLQQLLAKEGPKALFKGMSTPILSATFVNAIVFSSYNEAMTLMRADHSVKPTYSQVFIAGAVAGAVQCSVLCPTDLVKCRLQVQTSKKSGGPLKCIRDVYKERGWRGFYSGLGPLLMRDLPAFATYFSLYEVAKDVLETRGNPLWLSSCLAGGFAGVMSWVVVFPFDVLKSIVQTRPFTSQGGKELGMMATASELLRTRGPKVFFSGMSVALLRALPVNCIVFPVYEGSVRALGQLKYKRAQSNIGIDPSTISTAGTSSAATLSTSTSTPAASV